MRWSRPIEMFLELAVALWLLRVFCPELSHSGLLTSKAVKPWNIKATRITGRRGDESDAGFGDWSYQ